ncbi:MAG: tetratricopeptide repeat protein [Nitrospirota bacterium]
MRRDQRADLAVAAILITVTSAVFSPVLSHQFILFDDTSYVTENAVVGAGLTWQGVRWAFTTTFTGNWHPLTWLSHMADVQLFGMVPRWHHAMNVVLHLVNTLLLFVVLRTMTGAFWRSAAVAALFALHPLHVESVAWVAERKDVLSALFWMLAMAAYVRYVRDPRAARYALVALALLLGLLAKPMVVTLPFVLLLLDYWPLERLGRSSISWATVRPLIWEKIPLFALALTVSAATLYAQRAGGNVADVEHLSLATRVSNTFVAYLAYLEKTLWPRGLAAFYPHPATTPGGLSWWEVSIAVAVVLAISGLVLREAVRRRYLLVGWLWFLGTLVPVIGMVQIGQQGIADRYTYIPLIGLFIAAVWGLSDLVGAEPWRRRALGVVGAGVLAMASVVTWTQVGYWRDTVTLFEHAVRVTGSNRVAHLQLGAAYARQGRYDDAAAQYRAALAIKANSVEANNNLGIVLAQAGRPDDAAASFRAALNISPNDVRLHANLARALRQMGAVSEAVEHYRDAVRLDPLGWDVAMNLAWILATDADAAVRRSDEAIVLAEGANRRTGRSHPRVLDTLAAAYAAAGRYEEAAETAQRALSAALGAGDQRFAADIGGRIRLYQTRQPYRVVRTPP